MKTTTRKNKLRISRYLKNFFIEFKYRIKYGFGIHEAMLEFGRNIILAEEETK